MREISYPRSLRIYCLVAASLCFPPATNAQEQELLTAAGKPAEGPLSVFLGEPRFDLQVV